MSGSQRYRAAHKGTGRQTNDTGRRTKGIEGNRNELNAVHIQLWYMNTHIWEVVFILEKLFLFNMSKYLKYMNTRIWKVFFFFDQKYIYFGWPCSEYLKYMNTRIWEVFFTLEK